jgi:hypothetical protein
VSKGKDDLSTDDLEELFGYTLKYNTEHNITGILLYKSGSFLQVLEGAKDTLLSIFERIEEDPRHKEIFTILKGPSKKRIFGDYASRFSIVKTEEDLENIERYLDQVEDNIPNLRYVKGILEPFLL